MSFTSLVGCISMYFIPFDAIVNGIAFFLKEDFIYLFLAVLGLHCHTWTFSSCSEQGLVHGLLICGGFSCGTGALRHTGFSSFGSWAYLLCSMWDLPRSGIEPQSPAMAGGVCTSEPPGKPWDCFLNFWEFNINILWKCNRFLYIDFVSYNLLNLLYSNRFWFLWSHWDFLYI